MPSRSVQPAGIVYGLDDRPPVAQAIVLALQHVLTMFGATVAVPLLLGPAMGMQREEIGLLISCVMLSSGVATLVQTTFGSRLPIIQGVSFSFLAAFFGIIAAVGQTASQAGACVLHRPQSPGVCGAALEYPWCPRPHH